MNADQFFDVREFACWMTGGKPSRGPQTVERNEAKHAPYCPNRNRMKLTIGRQRVKLGKMPRVSEYVNLNL
jgi:hypothetical protein